MQWYWTYRGFQICIQAARTCRYALSFLAFLHLESTWRRSSPLLFCHICQRHDVNPRYSFDNLTCLIDTCDFPIPQAEPDIAVIGVRRHLNSFDMLTSLTGFHCFPGPCIYNMGNNRRLSDIEAARRETKEDRSHWLAMDRVDLYTNTRLFQQAWNMV